MIYNEYKGHKISALGMGAMRLPTIDGKEGNIDEAMAQKMVDYAYENGINYFDTAWGYHDGNSEIFMGKALSKYPRESYYLATKFPGYELSNFGKAEEIFEKQIEKCGVEYFDFYLLHNLSEMNVDEYLNEEEFHTIEYLEAQKEQGRIKHLGFSAHGTYDTIKRFLEKFGDKMEFAQLQVNYFDWTFQKAKDTMALFEEYDLPVVVMEPVRGGKLANLDEKYVEMLKEARPDENAVAWAFRFIQGLPNIITTLSGFSDEEQTRQNIATYQESKPLSDDEKKILAKIVADMLSEDTVPCTACRYCTTYCPMELDIPKLIELYNQNKITKMDFIAPMYFAKMPKEKKPSACIACRKCEEVCPQQIKVSEVFAEFAEKRRYA